MKNYLKTATVLSKLLDNKFKFLGIKFGLDPVLGLIPGGGDLVSLVLSLYIVWVGIKMRLPQDKLAKMIGNVILDFGVGLVPILGDIADVTFKSNIRNLEILKQHEESEVMEGEVVG
ncbi:hypothetical protein A2380_03955 [candidate division WWE3 bacterium RIFOXYB1_FULL_43_24]|uniref:DUF4112 domain-containing protein n=2 Tax=Katanobacteria TaxID=422282 RepID=A0A0G0YR60_UNCKA|nr:MAG: hypothetical protein UU92_C0003G0048 [candidate division WWE3 bacterium GW2011_GWA1_42_12]KKS33784.1 MAG: hypothetical protein UU97_C0021G0010 [candidate division WWE3 bacterium GW2011_GWD1_42_14]KKS39122.1 MAG: hypothetical protein UV00_C0004G0048 [candidate division WWE3 bacterium GW2011_GWF1_42_14]KKS40652.1 MAG: hypothetical protein UV03_C0004G0048 [candidate division WWE3 bacterium GW2011_GWE1_42_16]KKS65360.1 MAG: hypothetical protein UV35_C0043G0005 [candidate division WWE3 bacte